MIVAAIEVNPQGLISAKLMFLMHLLAFYAFIMINQYVCATTLIFLLQTCRENERGRCIEV